MNQSPKRIVSLVPSLSELLVSLGLINNLVGVTRFCTHPDELRRTKVMVGGTKDPDLKKISRLEPELIICNKEENRKEDVENLLGQYPTYTSDVNTLNEAIALISDIGRICQVEQAAESMNKAIQSGFAQIQKISNQTVVYLIWQDPIMVVGGNNFINSMLGECGYLNLFSSSDQRYLASSLEEIGKLKPDHIFLSSEPYPFKSKNKLEFEHHFPDSKISLVDGRAFSWYGSHLVESPAYFNSLTKALNG